MKYKFWFEVEIDDDKCEAGQLQSLFENVANAIQTVCPFNDDDWNYAYKDEGVF